MIPVSIDYLIICSFIFSTSSLWMQERPKIASHLFLFMLASFFCSVLSNGISELKKNLLMQNKQKKHSLLLSHLKCTTFFSSLEFETLASHRKISSLEFSLSTWFFLIYFFVLIKPNSALMWRKFSFFFGGLKRHKTWDLTK